MISFIRGTVFACASSLVDVDVHGVGYRVWVPERVALSLAPEIDVFLYTYHQVREDAHELFGFQQAQERDWFELLLTVSGIGPKGALQIISASLYEDFAKAVESDDDRYLCSLPGIGKKTAQRLVLELKDKLSSFRLSLPTVRTSLALHVDSPISRLTALQRDVVEALKSLGYNEKQALDAVLTTLAAEGDAASTWTVEQALRLCLSQFVR